MQEQQKQYMKSVGINIICFDIKGPENKQQNAAWYHVVYQIPAEGWSPECNGLNPTDKLNVFGFSGPFFDQEQDKTAGEEGYPKDKVESNGETRSASLSFFPDFLFFSSG